MIFRNIGEVLIPAVTQVQGFERFSAFALEPVGL